MENLFIGNIDKSVSIYGKYCYDNAIVAYNKDYKYYWISIGVFGLEKCIYKQGISIIIASDTEEYDTLTRMIKNEDNNMIEKYVNLIIIKHADPKYIYQMIEMVKDKKYQQGRKDVQDEMRKALGI